jgi:hypothetical protein
VDQRIIGFFGRAAVSNTAKLGIKIQTPPLTTDKKPVSQASSTFQSKRAFSVSREHWTEFARREFEALGIVGTAKMGMARAFRRTQVKYRWNRPGTHVQETGNRKPRHSAFPLETQNAPNPSPIYPSLPNPLPRSTRLDRPSVPFLLPTENREPGRSGHARLFSPNILRTGVTVGKQ